MITEEQLEIRKTGIGASESSKVLGISKWGTALDVYLDKIGESPEQEFSEAAHFGNVLEQVVADEYERRTGLKVRKNNKTLRHNDHDFILCHLDRVVTGEKRIVECKTASAYLVDAWGDENTDQVPDDYYIQVQHQLSITGYEYADIPVLLGGNQFRIYAVKRDAEMIDYIVSTLVEFWNNNVLAGVPPEIDYDHKSTEDLLKKMHPGTNGNDVDITALEQWHNVRLDALAKVKEYEAVASGAKNHILAAIGGNATGIIDGIGSYDRKLVKRKGFSVEPTEYMSMRFKKQK